MADTATDHVEEISGETRIPSQDKDEKGGDFENVTPSDEYSHTVNPKPWRFEHWIPGGYSQSRMLRFNNPSTMYKVINFFAGEEFWNAYILF